MAWLDRPQSQPYVTLATNSPGLIQRLVASVSSLISSAWSTRGDDPAEANGRDQPRRPAIKRRQVSAGGGGGSASVQLSQLSWDSYEASDQLEANDLEAGQDSQAASNSASGPLVDEDLTRVRVHGPGSVPGVPIVRIGDRLELECTGSGYPIDTLRWFRQGQVINTQSSSDFQTELSTVHVSWNTNPPQPQLYHSMQVAVNQSGPPPAGVAKGRRVGVAGTSQRAGSQQAPTTTLVSRLLIRQLQPRDTGLVMFECLAENSHGDRARSSLAVYIAEREQVDEARSKCPLEVAATMLLATNATSSGFQATEAQASSSSSSSSSSSLNDDDDSAALVKLAFKRQNPFRTALVLEGEPIELECPAAPVAATPPSSDTGGAQKTIGEQIDWFKWWPSTGAGE